MFTKALDIDGPVGRLEAVLMTPATKKPVAAAVICHVHPLHGEVMHYKLLFRVKDRRFQAAPSSCPPQLFAFGWSVELHEEHVVGYWRKRSFRRAVIGKLPSS